MNIFGNGFVDELTSFLVDTVKNAFDKFSESQQVNARYLRMDEVRKYCGNVSLNTVRSWEALGLKQIKINGCSFYDREDIDVLMAKNKM